MKSISKSCRKIELNARTLLAGAGLMVVAAAMTACSSSDVSYMAISTNLTPELQGTVERPIDVNRHMAVTFNQNLRSASDDLGRVLYTDHPSRLSPFPIVATSGMPR